MSHSNPSFNSATHDPDRWLEKISDAKRCDQVKRGALQLVIDIPFSNGTPRRRFSSVRNKRVLANGECVIRSWPIYSVESNRMFCVCCSLSCLEVKLQTHFAMV